MKNVFIKNEYFDLISTSKNIVFIIVAPRKKESILHTEKFVGHWIHRMAYIKGKFMNLCQPK